MQLFYSPEITTETTEFTFNKTESNHIIKVLRKKENDIINITDGNGLLAKVQIINDNSKKCTVKIIKSTINTNSLNYHLHIAIAPTKNNQRYEWFLEKVTEIGINKITPIICNNSERKKINSERYQKVLITAMKQANALYLPKLNEAMSFKNIIKNSLDYTTKFIAHCHNSEKKSLKSELENNKKILILIGPEGDFSQDEVNFALKNGFKPISLGETRLRTETAGIVAAHSIAFNNQ